MLKACEKCAGSTVDADSLGLARKRLVVASSLLSCAVLIVALIAAWGFSVDTSYKSDATQSFPSAPTQPRCRAVTPRPRRRLRHTSGRKPMSSCL